MVEIVHVGYRVVLPPGWARVPVRDHPEHVIDELLAATFDQLPADRYGPVRREMRAKLTAQIERARENRAVDLYFPTEPRGGQPVPASFVVGLLQLEGSTDEATTEDVLVAFAARSEHATVAEIDGAPAVRTDQVIAASSGGDERSFASRRVDYLLAIPSGHDRWMTVSFSTLGDGDPNGEVANLLVELFDAIMTTFRWVLE